MDNSPESQGSPKSRPTSRRSSASLPPRRNSVKKDKDRKPTSAQSTPKKNVKTTPDFMVTGKQILKKSDRANSLPGSYRRPSSDVSATPRRRPTEAVVRLPPSASSAAMKSKETSLEEDVSLDLSQVSDFEDTNSKYGIPSKLTALATSTPKPKFKPRSASLQSQLHAQKFDKKGILEKSLEGKTQSSLDGRSRDSTFSYSRDSLYKTSSSASPHRYELDYSSVSPEYSGQSSTEESPRLQDLTTPASLQASSCCVSSWQDSELDTKVCGARNEGEWGQFWANYNYNYKGAPVPVARYYDQCPTPYRTETIDMADFDLSTEGPNKRSPNNITNINSIIRNEGLTLTPRETQNIIKCAHILGNVLSKAIERRSREKDDLQIEEVNEEVIRKETKDITIGKDKNGIHTENNILTRSETEDNNENKRKNLKPLNLREQTIPLEVKEEKKSETATTQTDISLPNTKSAPRIFESILRQLSKSSIDEVKHDASKEEREVKKNMEKEAKKDTEKEVKKDTEKEAKKDTEKEVKKDTEKEAKKDTEKEVKKDTEKEAKKDTEKEVKKDTEKEVKTE